MATTQVAVGTMKVAQITTPGGEFQVVEREIRAPGPGAGTHQGAGVRRLPQ